MEKNKATDLVLNMITDYFGLSGADSYKDEVGYILDSANALIDIGLLFTAATKVSLAATLMLVDGVEIEDIIDRISSDCYDGYLVIKEVTKQSLAHFDDDVDEKLFMSAAVTMLGNAIMSVAVQTFLDPYEYASSSIAKVIAPSDLVQKMILIATVLISRSGMYNNYVETEKVLDDFYAIIEEIIIGDRKDKKGKNYEMPFEREELDPLTYMHDDEEFNSSNRYDAAYNLFASLAMAFMTRQELSGRDLSTDQWNRLIDVVDKMETVRIVRETIGAQKSGVLLRHLTFAGAVKDNKDAPPEAT